LVPVHVVVILGLQAGVHSWRVLEVARGQVEMLGWREKPRVVQEQKLRVLEVARGQVEMLG
jgi:hypothetical protein